jgi:hypothetical protein
MLWFGPGKQGFVCLQVCNKKSVIPREMPDSKHKLLEWTLGFIHWKMFPQGNEYSDFQN